MTPLLRRAMCRTGMLAVATAVLLLCCSAAPVRADGPSSGGSGSTDFAPPLVVPLTGCPELGFTATVRQSSSGSSPKFFQLQLDTMAPGMSLATAACSDCPPELEPRFAPVDADRTNDERGWTRWDGTHWSGDVVHAQIGLQVAVAADAPPDFSLDASVSVLAIDNLRPTLGQFFPVGSCDAAAEAGSATSIPFQGVLGLAPPSMTPSTAYTEQSLWEQLLGAAHLAPQLTLQLCDRSGQIWFGDPLSSMEIALQWMMQYVSLFADGSAQGDSSPLHFTEMQMFSEPAGYAFGVQAMYLEDADTASSTTVSPSPPENAMLISGRAVLDSAGAFWVLPRELFAAVTAQIDAHPVFSARFGADGTYWHSSTCKSLPSADGSPSSTPLSAEELAALQGTLPRLVLRSTSGLEVSLPALGSYIVPCDAEHQTWQSGLREIESAEAPQDLMRLGWSFLRNVVVQIDQRHEQMGLGFGASKGCSAVEQAERAPRGSGEEATLGVGAAIVRGGDTSAPPSGGLFPPGGSTPTEGDAETAAKVVLDFSFDWNALAASPGQGGQPLTEEQALEVFRFTLLMEGFGMAGLAADRILGGSQAMAVNHTTTPLQVEFVLLPANLTFLAPADAESQNVFLHIPSGSDGRPVPSTAEVLQRLRGLASIPESVRQEMIAQAQQSNPESAGKQSVLLTLHAVQDTPGRICDQGVAATQPGTGAFVEGDSCTAAVTPGGTDSATGLESSTGAKASTGVESSTAADSSTAVESSTAAASTTADSSTAFVSSTAADSSTGEQSGGGVVASTAVDSSTGVESSTGESSSGAASGVDNRDAALDASTDGKSDGGSSLVAWAVLGSLFVVLFIACVYGGGRWARQRCLELAVKRGRHSQLTQSDEVDDIEMGRAAAGGASTAANARAKKPLPGRAPKKSSKPALGSVAPSAAEQHGDDLSAPAPRWHDGSGIPDPEDAYYEEEPDGGRAGVGGVAAGPSLGASVGKGLGADRFVIAAPDDLNDEVDEEGDDSDMLMDDDEDDALPVRDEALEREQQRSAAAALQHKSVSPPSRAVASPSALPMPRSPLPAPPAAELDPPSRVAAPSSSPAPLELQLSDVGLLDGDDAEFELAVAGAAPEDDDEDFEQLHAL